MALFKNKKFLFNVFIGVSIAIFFHFLQHTEFGESLFNKFFDLSIKHWGNDSSQNGKGEILFIDIDQDTYDEWGLPYFTPIDTLSNIISFAVKNNAKIIFVDIDLDSRKEVFYPKQIERLKKLLSNLPDGNEYSQILFSSVPNRSDNYIQRTIVDSLIDIKQNIHKVVPFISKSSSDQIARYSRYYHIAKNESGEEDLFWSPIFLAVAIKRDIRNEYLDSLKEEILTDYLTLGEVHKDYRVQWPNGDEIVLSNADIFTNRIKFYYRFDQNSAHNANLELTDRLTFNRVYSNPDLFNNKIVVIGVSSPDLGDDIHLTPIGEQPGMYIIGNSMLVLLDQQQIFQINILIRYALELIVILIAAFLFVKFSSVIAHFISILIILCVLGPITIYVYYKFGVFIDLIFPVLGISLHKFVAGIEDTFHHGRKAN